MMNRRKSLASMLALTTAGWASHSVAKPVGSCVVMNKDHLKDMTPDQALKHLQEGNARFVAGKTVNCDLMQQVKGTSGGQAPFAAVVGCIDSRVPPELVFDQRLGDIFAARVAGNFVNTDIIGSLEYAAAVVGSKLLVVLGHSDCGAVKAAIDDVKLGNITALLANIHASVERVRYTGVRTSKDKKLVAMVTEQNARDTASAVVSRSPLIADLVKNGKVKVVSAVHDVSTGKVTWFS